VLPVTQTVGDYADRVNAAVRTLAFSEHRLPEEVSSDISLGGADRVVVRLTPDAPSGEVPLSLAQAALSALYSFVVGSATAIEIHEPVLPSRRPAWTESYASKTRLSICAATFALNLALPLAPELGHQRPAAEPLGRQVSDRMIRAAQSARRLAEAVSAGDRPLRAFGQDPVRPSANTTELAALKALGGPNHDVYQLRFAQSPLVGQRRDPVTLRITPGQQRILGEAAAYVRSTQPRSGV
jgi:hypothetical protein